MDILDNTHRAVMKEYDRRRLASRRRLDLKESEVYSKNPRFSQIDAEIARTTVDYVEGRLSGSGENISLRTVIDGLKKEKASLLSALGYPEDYLNQEYSCPDCMDTGFVNGRKCHCYKELATKVMYNSSSLKNITPEHTFEHFSFDLYDDSYVDPITGKTPLASAKNAFDKARSFIDNFDDSFENLFIYGNTGVGKTFLINCIANELVRSNKSIIYNTSFELFDTLARYTFRENNTEGLYDYILDCDLLIIDDLGTELVNSFVSSQIFLIVNERILRKKSTIISTNLSVNDIIDNYSERTFSRISYAYDIIKLTGADIRIKKKIY